MRGFEVGLANQQHFFVMEHVDGPSLQELVEANGSLPIDRAVEYIRQAALGLQHAYEKGQAHEPVSTTRSRARVKALKRESRAAVSKTALSRQAKQAAAKRSASERSAAAKKAARTKGPRERSMAAKKAARARASHAH